MRTDGSRPSSRWLRGWRRRTGRVRRGGPRRAGACRALGGSFAALSVWERELGRLRVLVNVGERAEGEEEFPEDEAYPVHQFAEITEFLHEQWAGGGEPDAWVETAEGPAAGRQPGYCHQRVAALRRRGRGCCVVAPIVLHGRAWGELYVARPAGEPVFGRGDADFATVLASVVAAGIAQTERLEEARRLAFTDALTGLANRRAVDVRLDEAVERHRGTGAVVSLVVCDLNGLKRVNDTHGHAVGDRLLERFGSVLSLCGAMLPGALAARLGGDEFCLLAVGPVRRRGGEGGRRTVPPGGRVGAGGGGRLRGRVHRGPDRAGALRPAAVPARRRRPVPGQGRAGRSSRWSRAGRGPTIPSYGWPTSPVPGSGAERRRFRGRHGPDPVLPWAVTGV